MIANKCKSLVSAYVPYPTHNINMVTPGYDDDITVVTSNKTNIREQPPATMAEPAHKLLGNPMPQYLNA
jgi:hypothetical protein